MNDPFFILVVSFGVTYALLCLGEAVIKYRAAQRRAAEHFDGREQVPADSFPAAKNGERARNTPPVGSLTKVLRR